MRKVIITFALLSSILLSGCSVLEEVNSSLEYVNEATEHINTWKDFGEEAPQMIQDAATDVNAKEELETRLNEMLVEIDEFNNTEAPAIAESVHQQIVDKNQELKNVIENAMVDGEVALEKLQDSELYTLINEVTTMMNLLEELGS
ncbi:hypothetical protein FZC76_18490 [Sutcliffiella horikoshii]|uniref:Lipoprotein n=1 Tax=Sutcliffiella horikoshii TaxID=79883 RepID=A0A5D4SQS0_9BACI|nr:DUF6376 family protein [Sutcliffiella horikoshii]TYS64548.1 hypothetical protein FZC76_18490 [Sutcliffiella horikoshii]